LPLLSSCVPPLRSVLFTGIQTVASHRRRAL
jgi:hypothetical protein